MAPHRSRRIDRFFGALVLGALSAPTALAVAPGTSFTYQGTLENSGNPVTTTVDVRFTLYSDAAGTAIVGTAQTKTNITPVDGVFSTSLDFGAAAYADNQARWMKIEVSPAGAGTWTNLGIQKLEGAPYALNSRGISVNEATSTVTLTDKILTVDLPNSPSIPSGSQVELSTPGGLPGLILRYGDGAGGTLYRWNMWVETDGSLNFNNQASLKVLSISNSSGVVGIGGVPLGSAFQLVVRDGGTGASWKGALAAGGSSSKVVLGQNNGYPVIGAHNGALNAWQNLTICPDGSRVGIGTYTPATALDVVGAVTIRGGADIVEGFDTSEGDAVEPGTVMVIDPEHPGKLMPSTGAYDARVAGVVSGANGVNPGIKLGDDGHLDGDLPIAMTGRVYVRASAENGAIHPGDRLTSATLAGHAMRATDAARCDGAVIGKAMTGLDSGTGMVLVLVNLQ